MCKSDEYIRKICQNILSGIGLRGAAEIITTTNPLLLTSGLTLFTLISRTQEVGYPHIGQTCAETTYLFQPERNTYIKCLMVIRHQYFPSANEYHYIT